MTKRAIAITLTALLLLLFSFSVSAEIIPEENLIGETLVIEPDENIVKGNIQKGNPDESYAPETDEVIDMTKDTYLKRCVRPVILLFLSGILLLIVTEGIKKLREKRILAPSSPENKT